MLILFYSIEDGSVRLGYSRNQGFQGLVAGLLRPRPSLKPIDQSSSSGKFHEQHSPFKGSLYGTARVKFFIEPPPDAQQRRRRGERGTGVTKGSYLLLNNLPLPLPLPPTHAARLLGCLGLRYQDTPPFIVHVNRPNSVIFKKSGQKV